MGFFENITFGFCWWDVLSLIVLFAVAAYVFISQRKLKKEKKEVENQ